MTLVNMWFNDILYTRYPKGELRFSLGQGYYSKLDEEEDDMAAKINKRYFVMYRSNGSFIRTDVNTAYTTKEDALEAAVERMKDYNDGAFVAEVLLQVKPETPPYNVIDFNAPEPAPVV